MVQLIERKRSNSKLGRSYAKASTKLLLLLAIFGIACVHPVIDIPDCDPLTEIEIHYLKSMFAVAGTNEYFIGKIREMNATCAGVHSWH